jgi:hypothetical protein
MCQFIIKEVYNNSIQNIGKSIVIGSKVKKKQRSSI